jgi:hypothetical protein
MHGRIGEKSLEMHKQKQQHNIRIRMTYQRRLNDKKRNRERQLRRVLQQKKRKHPWKSGKGIHIIQNIVRMQVRAKEQIRATIRTTGATRPILTIVVRQNNKEKGAEFRDKVTVVMGALEGQFVLCVWEALLLALWSLLIRVEYGTSGYIRGRSTIGVYKTK